MLSNDLKMIGRGIFGLQKMLGTGIFYIGMFSLFVMSVVGTIAVDIVLLAALANSRDRSAANFFLTGYLWGSLFSPGRGYYGDMGVMLLASPFLTGLAIVLSVVLGVPGVGIGLAMGWAIAGSITLVGATLTSIANVFLNASWMQKSPDSPPTSAVSVAVSSSHRTGMAPLLSSPRKAASETQDTACYARVYKPSAPPALVPSALADDEGLRYAS